MTPKLQQIIENFSFADEETRLDMLLDFARRLPPLPQRYCEERDAGLNRVHECMTPVFLWVEREDGRARFFVDVAEEAPTVRGLLSILVDAYDGATPGEIGAIPDDLLNRLGLSGAIRMQRAVGLAGIIRRLKRDAVADDAPAAHRDRP